MKLGLRNIGKIECADVEINGITVIAGENNTGKSTIGKALFAAFNSFYDIDNKILNERIYSIKEYLDKFIMHNNFDLWFDKLEDDKLARNIAVHTKGVTSVESVKDIIRSDLFLYNKEFVDSLDDSTLDKFITQVVHKMSVSDNEIFKSVVQKYFTSEFNSQICNIYSEDIGEIVLEIKGAVLKISVENDSIFDISSTFKLNTEAIYIDDPFVLDYDSAMWMWNQYSRFPNHRVHLVKKLFDINNNVNVVDEIIANRKLDFILNKVSSVCEGDIVKEQPRDFRYKVNGNKNTLDIRNLSTGMKTFAILKMLLTNGSIEPNGTIILDEPEIHLHPEWQLVFAEIIVLLNKEFGLHIVLNTHSPYFLDAIEVYAAKYDVADVCKYYLMENSNKGAIVIDVTDDIEQIYSKLARPLQILENERYQYD